MSDKLGYRSQVLSLYRRQDGNCAYCGAAPITWVSGWHDHHVVYRTTVAATPSTTGCWLSELPCANPPQAIGITPMYPPAVLVRLLSSRLKKLARRLWKDGTDGSRAWTEAFLDRLCEAARELPDSDYIGVGASPLFVDNADPKRPRRFPETAGRPLHGPSHGLRCPQGW